MIRPLLSLLIVFLLTTESSIAGEIRIGEFASLTGKEAAFGQSSHRGTLLAIEELNKRGGVLGDTLVLISEDNQSKPGESVTAVKKLISRDKVVAVLGEVASSRSLEGASVCQAFRIPMVSPFSTNPRVTEIGDYIFRVCFIDPFQGTLLARFAFEKLKVRRIALLTSSSAAYSVGLSRYFSEAFKAQGGSIVSDQKYAEGDKDFKAQLTAARATKPDAIVMTGYYTEGALICRQARQLDLQVPILGGDGLDAPELISIGGADVEGLYLSTHFSAEDKSPQARDFVAAYTRRFGQGPDASAALGYDSAMILADALRRAGSTKASAIRDALSATKDYSAVTGLISIDAARNARKSAVILQVRGGALRFVESVSP